MNDTKNIVWGKHVPLFSEMSAFHKMRLGIVGNQKLPVLHANSEVLNNPEKAPRSTESRRMRPRKKRIIMATKRELSERSAGRRRPKKRSYRMPLPVVILWRTCDRPDVHWPTIEGR